MGNFAGPIRRPMSWMIVLVGLLTIAPTGEAVARQYDMGSDTFATYFGGSFGLSNLSDYAFGSSSGVGVQTDQVVRSNYSGEFGVALTSMRGGLRLGVEYLMGRALSGVNGVNSSGTKLFELDSKVTAIVPMISAEAPLWKNRVSRVLLGGGAGYAFVSLDQEYEMTAAGTAALGVGDYSEKASARVPTWKAYVAAETHFVDITTVMLEAGYRSVRVGALQSTKATAAISGAQSEGSDLKNMDGDNRAFDFGGAYVSVFFRFYL